MRTAEIRQAWLDYFETRGHVVVPSASLVSPDPTVMFTIAGMVPFIPYMTGEQTAPWPRATSVQKCVRTLDIEEVGRTTRHGTFFQMNGNFSFGDYFKAEAIAYAWELITTSELEGGLGFDPDTIWVTVFQDDDEAASLWREIAGLPDERIQRRGRSDNFWTTGQPGPAGPCSEIYVDRGPEYGAEGGPIVDEDRYLEIWNLVFMQYAIDDVKSKEDFRIVGDLKRKNIDTGLGLERVAYLKQGKDNMYEIDEVFPVIQAAQELSGRTYGVDYEDDVRFRVVADHVRSGLMLIGDGVVPSNEGRGYVLRRLLRRSVRSMRLLGVQEPALEHLLPTSMNVMKDSYPELEQDFQRISQVAYAEEEAFRRTLEAGSQIFDVAVKEAKDKAATGNVTVSGADAFKMHDTYGFPIDLTVEMAHEQGVQVDEKAFRSLMQEQRERARADAMAKRGSRTDTTAYQELLQDLTKPVEFLGYTDLTADVEVVGLLVDGVPVPTAQAPADVEIITNHTPFYAEAGGQLPDHGTIALRNGGHLVIDDVQSPVKGLIVHHARLVDGTVTVGDPGVANVDATRRRAVSKAHSATHIIHKAVREALGDTATQAGSENAPNRVRFDFRSGSGLSGDALQEVEERVNVRLADNLEVTDEVTTLDRAREMGAMALFGEKYGDRVRMVSIGGDWSRELCAGTHIKQSGEIGRIVLLSDSSIGSGVRRVEALVSDGAYEFHAREHALVGQISTMLNARPDEMVDRISGLLSKLKDTEKELAKTRAAQLQSRVPELVASALQVGSALLVAENLGSVSAVDDIRTVVTDVRARLGESQATVVAIAGEAGGRPVIVVATNTEARGKGVRAGGLVRTAAQILGGGGGGKDDLAQGGGSDVTAIGAALAAIRQQLEADLA